MAVRRFVTHALIFAALQGLILAGAWAACPDDPGHYMAATLDKHELLRDAPSPRLILVGGSSMGFSVDSGALVEALPGPGRVLAPVNMGLNDGLGLAFMLGEVEGQLRAGDVVIVAPEPHLFWTGPQDDAVWAVLQRRPASLACLAAAGPRAVAEVSDQSLHFFARKLRCAAHQMSTDRELPTIYRRSSFDTHGDFVAHRGQPAKREQSLERPWPGPGRVELELDRSMAQLGGFFAHCEAVGARCFMAWCPMRAATVARERATYEAIDARLRELGVEQLEGFEEAAHPEGDFFDRGPHLSGEAATRRSLRLAERLAARL